MKFNLELTVERAKVLVGVLGHSDMDATVAFCSSIHKSRGGRVSFVHKDVDDAMYEVYNQLDDQLREIDIEVE